MVSGICMSAIIFGIFLCGIIVGFSFGYEYREKRKEDDYGSV